MQSILKNVEKILSTAMKNTLTIEERANVDISPHIGDYRCSNAIKLFNQYKKSGSFGCATVKDLADKIIKGIPENVLIEKAEATPMKRIVLFFLLPVTNQLYS